MRDHNSNPTCESSQFDDCSRLISDTPTRPAGDSHDLAALPKAIEPREDLRVLGPYEVIRMLGQGGMGMVLLGHDPALDRSVAIKLLRSDRNDEESRRRFVREARAAAAIQHDHVVTIHSVANPRSGLPYFVMPYIEGPTLRERLDSETQLEPAHAAQLAIEIASGLSAAHEAGLVHRDIKPDNVMLDSADGRAKIMDFGLVRLPDSEGVTQTGISAGTPEYMSPEQIDRPASVDARTDVYSLGVTFYEMLTGTRPFAGAPHMVMQQVLADEPRPPRKLNDRIPRDLEVICLRGMEKDPACRYQTAAEFSDDLARWKRGEAILARPVGVFGRLLRWRRRQPALANLATALVLVVTVAIGAIVFQWRRAEYHLAEARRQEIQRMAKEAEAAEASRRAEQASKRVAQESQKAKDATRQAEQARGQILSVVLQSQIRQDTRPQNASRKFFEALAAMPMTVIEQHADDPSKATEVATAYMSLGQMKWRAGEPTDALAAYREARDRYVALSREQPNEAKQLHLSATAHHWVGTLEQEVGDSEAAVHAHQQAREIQRKLVELDPAAPNYLLDLANSEIAIGTLQTELPQAIRTAVRARERDPLDRARRVLSRIERAMDARAAGPLRKDLALAYRKLGDALRLSGEVVIAPEVYQRAIELGRAASAGAQNQIDVQSELAIALNQLGECWMAADRLGNAAEVLREAVSLQRQILKRSPFNNARIWLARHLHNLTQVQRQRGDLRAAIEAISERKQLTPGDPKAVFECVCEFARCLPETSIEEQRDEITSLALEALSHALDVGFEDIERLNTDPALAPLRETKEFQQAVSTLEARP